MTLALVCDNDRIRIIPRSLCLSGPWVRVWGGRVRASKTKLRLGDLATEAITVEGEEDGLMIAIAKRVY